MTQEQLEGNKLIAEFMGLRLGAAGDLINEDADCHVMGTKYHSSWDDWLMPVVEKIEKDVSKAPYLGFTVRIVGNSCLISCHEKNKQDGVIYQTPWGYRPLTKIEAVWLAVVEFIKWYNQTK